MTPGSGGATRGEKRGDFGLPSLRFRYPVELHARTLAVLDTLESEEDPARHREPLADIVLELTEAGLDWYFLKAVRGARAGFMTEKSVMLGLAGIRRLVGPVVRRVIGGMTADQLRSIGAHIRQLMK